VDRHRPLSESDDLSHRNNQREGGRPPPYPRPHARSLLLYDVVGPEGDRRQDLTGVHAAAESAWATAAAVPWRINVRCNLDDLLVQMT
jgi:hypothetical protein